MVASNIAKEIKISNRFGTRQLTGRIEVKENVVQAKWPGHRMSLELDSKHAAAKLAEGLAVVPVNHSVLIRLGFKETPSPAGRRGKAREPARRGRRHGRD